MSKVESRRALMRTTALVGMLCAGLWSADALAQAQTFAFDIPSETLRAGLQDVARISGQQIIFSDSVASGKIAPALHGSFTADEALNRLLEGTDLVAVHASSGGIMVKPKNAQAASNEGAAETTGSIETVVVTGTLIPGVSPASPVITLDRATIDRSGYQTTGDVVRNLPQSFAGGQNFTVVGAGGSQNVASASAASSANLRGLGSESTLTLVDGHRLAYDGLIDSVDISQIPLGAVDRVEVVTDGASATYGADAVAGVVNFIMRHDFDGLQVGSTIGGATDGGGFEQIYNGLAGKDWTGGNVVVSYEHAQQDEVNSIDRPFVSPVISGTSLIPATDRDSFFGRAQQSLSNDVTLFAEGLYTKRSADSELNDSSVVPGLVAKQNASVEQYGFVGGVDVDLPDSWMLNAAGTLARDTSNTPEQEFLGGHLLATVSGAYGNRMDLFSLNASGPLATIGAGDIDLALGAEYRDERFTSNAQGALPGVSASRRVFSAFGELQVPLVLPSDARAGLESLNLDVAGRFENYSDFGSTANPKVGLVYKPVDDLKLRGTWSTSFRAPSLLQEFDPDQANLQFVPNATPPGGVAVILSSFGGSPNLGPEKSTSTSVGADYSPHWLPNLTTSVSYFNIDYRDRIEIPIVNTEVALTDPTFAQFVTRNPSAAMLNAAIAQAAIFNNLTGAPFNPATVAAYVDNRYQNFAQQNANGVDLLADYRWDSSWGAFDVSLNSAFMNLTQRYVAGGLQQTLSGTLFNIASTRLRAGANWSFAGWDASAFVNYVGPSKDPDVAPAPSIGSWTTVDTRISYRFDDDSFLGGSTLALIVNNLFDRDPPSVPASATTTPGLNYDSTNASAIGRLISFEVTKKW
jgi:iron complex outermembrane recepter protein